MSDDAKRQAYERTSILMRLEARERAYVARPDGQAAVRDLKAKGLVEYVWGEGSDAGIMIVRMAATGRPTLPRPFTGGDVA